jgi:hypothetical protein
MKMSGEELRAIMADVRANQARLEQCEQPHSFEPIPPTIGMAFSTHSLCSVCGGRVSASDARWYARGLEAGRRMGKSMISRVHVPGAV